MISTTNSLPTDKATPVTRFVIEDIAVMGKAYTCTWGETGLPFLASWLCVSKKHDHWWYKKDLSKYKQDNTLTFRVAQGRVVGRGREWPGRLILSTHYQLKIILLSRRWHIGHCQYTEKLGGASGPHYWPRSSGKSPQEHHHGMNLLTLGNTPFLLLWGKGNQSTCCEDGSVDGPSVGCFTLVST